MARLLDRRGRGDALLAAKRGERGNEPRGGAGPLGIRGTHFGALYCNDDCANVPAPAGGPPANGLHVDVADGRIIVATRAGVLEIAVGQFGYVQSGDSVPVQVPESQGIRVTLPPQAVNPAIRGGTVGTGNHLECTIR